MHKDKQRNILHIKTVGFTLIELLVVISIISILMSISLPSLNKAQSHGKTVHCLSNLKNLTLAWIMYAYNNDGQICSSNTLWNDKISIGNWVADGPDLPTNDTGGTKKAIKDGVLWSFVESLDVYKCKSDASELLRSYSVSKNMGGGSVGVGYTTLAEITNVCEKLVFIDTKFYKPFSAPNRWIKSYYYPITSSGELRWTTIGGTTARHHGGSNLSFADGHTEYWKFKNRTTKLTNGEVPYISISDKNSDMQRMIKLLEGKK